MRTRYQLALAIVLTLFALPAAVHAQDAKTYEMKLSTATLNDPQHEWLKRFAAAVEKDSGGRIKAEVFPASQLGSIPRQIEGTQFGSIQAWAGPPEFLTGVDVRYETLSAPGLLSSDEQDLRVINDAPIREMMLGLGAEKGLQGVSTRSPWSVVDCRTQTGASSRRIRRHENSRSSFALPIRDDQTDECVSGSDVARRRLTGAAARRA